MSKPSDIRFTPQHVLDVVREFAPIALDPCTTATNPVQAKLHLTEREDGLERCWSGVIADGRDVDGVTFVNPPYSSGQLRKWARKAAEEWLRNSVESMLLVPADTSTLATQYLIDVANSVGFWRKRICFAGEQGAKFANALFYFGERQGRFSRVFSPHATVITLR